MEKNKSKDIQNFIMNNVRNNPCTITKLTAEKFGISRQAVNQHIKKLLEEDKIKATGNTRNRKYLLKPNSPISFSLPIKSDMMEDKVWRDNIGSHLSELPKNVYDICYYGFTEILNNVIDHSEGKTVNIEVHSCTNGIFIKISDDGIGIFEKIKSELGLDDHRHALLELSKGKLTTDPANHTGEGIFLTSRIFDEFEIASSKLIFNYHLSKGDFLVDDPGKSINGTVITMIIRPDSRRNSNDIFDEFAPDFDFSRTVVLVKLLQYENENLVSRSQAKRLLARFDKFKEVILNFEDVESIGQAFADEIFRVFRTQHPEINIKWMLANDSVEKMITTKNFIFNTNIKTKLKK